MKILKRLKQVLFFSFSIWLLLLFIAILTVIAWLKIAFRVDRGKKNVDT